MSTIEITRQNLSISQLRAEAARTGDAKQTPRTMVLDGHSRLLAAQADRRELLLMLKDLAPGEVVTVTQIDHLYRQRLHSALGYITPEQAERQAA